MSQALQERIDDAASSDDSDCRDRCREFELQLDLPLASGDVLRGARISARLAGPAGAPVLAVLGGISADRRPLQQPDENQPGWWEGVLGRDALALRERFQLLSFDYLGGAGDSSSPARASAE